MRETDETNCSCAADNTLQAVNHENLERTVAEKKFLIQASQSVKAYVQGYTSLYLDLHLTGETVEDDIPLRLPFYFRNITFKVFVGAIINRPHVEGFTTYDFIGYINANREPVGSYVIRTS